MNSGVGLININSRTEIARLAALARKLGKKPNVGIRVVVPGAAERAAVGGSGSTQARRSLDSPRRSSSPTPPRRSPPLPSQWPDHVAPAQLDAFLSPLLAFADELRARFGLALQIIDVGGNLTCPTVSPLGPRARRLAVTLGCEPSHSPPASALSIDDYVGQVVGRIEAHFVEREWAVPRIFVEPGRALTSDTQMLLCRAVTVRKPDETGIRWAVLDVGMHVAEPLTTEWHQVFPISPRADAAPRLYRLTGPSCMLCDQLYPAWKLPELSAGDGLAIMDTGAYFVAFSAPFSFPRPAIVMLDGARERLLRRAETFEDLVALDGEWGSLRRSDGDTRATKKGNSAVGLGGKVNASDTCGTIAVAKAAPLLRRASRRSRRGGPGDPPTMAGYGGTLAARALGRAGHSRRRRRRGGPRACRWSRHVTRAVDCPQIETAPMAFLDWLLALGAREPGRVLCTTSDCNAWFFARHRETLARHFRLYLPRVDAISALLNKWRLYEVCAPTWVSMSRGPGVRAGSTICLEVQREARFPVVIKPQTQILFLPSSEGTSRQRRGCAQGALPRTAAAAIHSPVLLGWDPRAGGPHRAVLRRHGERRDLRPEWLHRRDWRSPRGPGVAQGAPVAGAARGGAVLRGRRGVSVLAADVASACAGTSDTAGPSRWSSSIPAIVINSSTSIRGSSARWDSTCRGGSICRTWRTLRRHDGRTTRAREAQSGWPGGQANENAGGRLLPSH